MRALVRGTMAGLLKSKAKLQKKRNGILLQEVVPWMHTSRENWLKLGDRNTKFFHTSILLRRRRNKIEALLDDRDQWISDQKQLKEMAECYYSKLFNSDPLSGGEFISGQFPQLNADTI